MDEEFNGTALGHGKRSFLPSFKVRTTGMCLRSRVCSVVYWRRRNRQLNARSCRISCDALLPGAFLKCRGMLFQSPGRQMPECEKVSLIFPFPASESFVSAF